MDLFLQFLGGAGYLLNKVFFSCAERAHAKGRGTNARSWRIAAWVSYIVGLPLWVAIFIGRHDWIAASVEASGVPAMVLGLIFAIKRTEHKTPQWLHWFARGCVAFGLSASVYDVGGLATWTQWLEIGLAVGFLVGTYQCAFEKPSGYLWLILMHISCGWLMRVQGSEMLFWQQVASLVFIADAYWTRKRVKKSMGRV